MAEKVLKEFEDELNCSICLGTYTGPKLLQCFHVYCQKCLVKLAVEDQQGQLSLPCPICRQATPVPANGVAGLQPAFQINHLLEIVEKHKKATADSSASAELVVRDSTGLISQDKPKVCCLEHGGKEVELYCETCGEPICWKCVLKGSKHHSHDYEELDTAFEKYKVEITTSLEPMEKQLSTVLEALTLVDRRCGEISDQQAATEANIHSTFRRLQEILDTRKTELISQLHQIAQRKLKDLAVQRDQIETTLAQLNSCLGFMKESLKTGSQEEVLLMKTTVFKQVKELSTTFLPDTLKPNTEADIIFSALADITTLCQSYGQVSTSGSPDPSKCHVTGEGMEIAVVGQTSTAVLQTINFKGQPCKEPMNSPECELVSEITGTRTQGSIERRGQSKYEISYQPAIKGRHQLHVRMEDQHIRGSPFSVTAKLPVERISAPILTLRGVRKPWGVAINRRGEVIVSEWEAHCVSVFSPSGEKLRSFGTRGSERGQFKHPRGVAVDGEGNIVVADSGNHRIQKFTPEGQFLIKIGSQGNRLMQFSKPEGIVFNASNNKVYVSDSNHRIHVLNSDLSFSSTFGKHGNSMEQFSDPCGVACDSAGNVYVADYDNHRIQVFTAERKFLKTFGRHGDGRGKLNWPVGIAISSSDMVYVSEFGNRRVSVFTSEGEFVNSFGSSGDPYGIAVDNSQVVYVCNWNNNCIQVL